MTVSVFAGGVCGESPGVGAHVSGRCLAGRRHLRPVLSRSGARSRSRGWSWRRSPWPLLGHRTGVGFLGGTATVGQVHAGRRERLGAVDRDGFAPCAADAPRSGLPCRARPPRLTRTVVVLLGCHIRQLEVSPAQSPKLGSSWPEGRAASAGLVRAAGVDGALVDDLLALLIRGDLRDRDPDEVERRLRLLAFTVLGGGTEPVDRCRAPGSGRRCTLVDFCSMPAGPRGVCSASPTASSSGANGAVSQPIFWKSLGLYSAP